MDLNQDFQDLLAAFASSEVRYLLIGGYAVSVHGKPRYTKDIDLLIDAKENNLNRVAEALQAFGAPQRAIRDVRFGSDSEIVWFGNPPGRVDLFKRIPGVDFDEAFERRLVVTLLSSPTNVLSLQDLIASKRAAGRPQDLIDVENLLTIGVPKT